MRAMCFLPMAALLLAVPVAAEEGLMIRAGDLMAQPFIDAAKSGPLAANDRVTIVERRGGWLNVQSNGRSGWVRTLSVRMQAAPPKPAAAGQGRASPPVNARTLTSPTALLRTGSSRKTVTTGVKGIDEEDIRNASVNYAQLEQLGTLGVDQAEGRAHGEAAQLKESKVGYLPKGRGK